MLSRYRWLNGRVGGPIKLSQSSDFINFKLTRDFLTSRIDGYKKNLGIRPTTYSSVAKIPRFKLWLIESSATGGILQGCNPSYLRFEAEIGEYATEQHIVLLPRLSRQHPDTIESFTNCKPKIAMAQVLCKNPQVSIATIFCTNFGPEWHVNEASCIPYVPEISFSPPMQLITL